MQVGVDNNRLRGEIMNPESKLTITDSDGDVVQTFPETDMYSVIGLLDELATIKKDIEKLKTKTGVK